MKILLLMVLLSLSVISCKSEKEKLNDEFEKKIKTYLLSIDNNGLVIDSVIITSVSDLSEKSDSVHSHLSLNKKIMKMADESSKLTEALRADIKSLSADKDLSIKVTKNLNDDFELNYSNHEKLNKQYDLINNRYNKLGALIDSKDLDSLKVTGYYVTYDLKAHLKNGTSKSSKANEILFTTDKFIIEKPEFKD